MKVQIIDSITRSSPPVPAGWQVNPDKCLYLGKDTSAAYWLLGSDVYRVQDDFTRWLCSYAAWGAYTRINPVTVT